MPNINHSNTNCYDDDDDLLSEQEDEIFKQELGNSLLPFMTRLKEKGYIGNFVDEQGKYKEKILDICYILHAEIKMLLLYKEKIEDVFTKDSQFLSLLKNPNPNLDQESFAKQLVEDTKDLFNKNNY